MEKEKTNKPTLKLIIPPELTSLKSALKRIHLWHGSDEIVLKVPTPGEETSFPIRIVITIPLEMAEIEALRVGEGNEMEVDFEKLHVVKR